MPFDAKVEAALRALARPIETYRTAVVSAAERVRGLVMSEPSTRTGRAMRVRAELGAFAAGRIDPERFAAVLGGGPALDALTRRRVDRAGKVLQHVAVGGDVQFLADVPAGGNLRKSVATALGELGVAFGAARAVEVARAGRFEPPEHEEMLQAFPFERWNRSERRIAPPLVVTVAGADFRASALADVLDGGQKVICIVAGPCAPAPLVRLITPGTFVMQTNDPADLARIGTVDGPAIAAVLPDECARFVHDPAGGATLAERLTVSYMPEPTRRTVADRSAWHQNEELLQLAALGTAGVAAAAVASGNSSVPEDPAARLAAWMLTRRG